MCYLRPLYTMPVVPKITHTRNLRQNRVNYRVNWWGRSRETLHVYSTHVFTLPFIHTLCGYNLWAGQQKIEHAYRPPTLPRVPEITHTWFGPLWSHELNCFRLPMSPSRSGMLVQPSLIPMLVAGDLFLCGNVLPAPTVYHARSTKNHPPQKSEAK